MDQNESAKNTNPSHVAIIMDGNGRWAHSHGLPRLEGHRAGAIAVRRTINACLVRNVRFLTLFSFSTENWQRSDHEVNGLMCLFEEALTAHIDFLIQNRVRLRAIGDIDRLPPMVRSALSRDLEETGAFSRLDLILAVSYGSREEITTAARNLAQQAVDGKIRPDEITAEKFSETLWTKGIPDPELLIRSSGEMRISNFLLWQLAYSEIVVCPELWPEFDDAVFDRCLSQYQQRERRFGMTSAQISAMGL